MRKNNTHIFTVDRLPLFIGILVPFIIVVLLMVLNDVIASLNVLIIFFIVTAIIITFLHNPYWGFMLLLFYMPFTDAVTMPIINSGIRVIFPLLFIVWYLKHFMSGKTVFFDLIRSNRSIIFFIGSMFVSSLFAYKPKISFSEMIEIIAFIFLFIFVMHDVISSKRKLVVFITVIALSYGISSLLIINDFLSIGKLTTNTGDITRYGGIYRNANGAAAMMMTGIPFILFLSFNAEKFLARALFFLLFVTSFFALGLAMSRTYLIAFSVFILIYIMLSFRYKIINIKMFLAILLIFMTIASLTYFFFIDNIEKRASEDISEQKRYIVLRKGIDLFTEHPLVGVGLGNFKYVRTSGGKYEALIADLAAHDIVSHVFVSLGILGIVTLTILFFRVSSNFNRAAKIHYRERDYYWLNLTIVLHAGYIALLSSAIGSGVIFKSPLWMYYSLSVFMYSWKRFDNRNAWLSDTSENMPVGIQ